ncbi:MAG: hypothetical protein ACR2PT_20890, partial [Endozoicomonas sp.]
MKNIFRNSQAALSCGFVFCLILAVPRTGWAEIIKTLPNAVVEQRYGTTTIWQEASEEQVSGYYDSYISAPGLWTTLRIAPPILMLTGLGLGALTSRLKTPALSNSQVAYTLYAFGMLAAMQFYKLGQRVGNGLAPAWVFYSKYIYGSLLASDVYFMARRTYDYILARGRPVSSVLYPVRFQNAPLLAMFVQEVVNIREEESQQEESGEQEPEGINYRASILRVVSTLTGDSLTEHSGDNSGGNSRSKSDDFLRLSKLLKENNAYLDIFLGMEEGSIWGGQWSAVPGNMTRDSDAGPGSRFNHDISSGSVYIRLTGAPSRGSKDEILKSGWFDFRGSHQWVERLLVGSDKAIDPALDYASLLSPEVLGHLSDWIEDSPRWKGLLGVSGHEASRLLPGPEFRRLKRGQKRKIADSSGSACKHLNMGSSRYLLPMDLTLSLDSTGCLEVMAWDKKQNRQTELVQ